MRKKGIVTMAVLGMAAMGVTARAESTAEEHNVLFTQDHGKCSIEVSANYDDETYKSESVISVNVSWDSLQFVYIVNGQKQWNDVTHEYEDDTTKTWQAVDNTVTVTNHSNVPVNAAFTFSAEAGYKQVQGTFDLDSVSLPSAVGKDIAAPELSASTALTLSGTADRRIMDSAKVGVIHVDITSES